MRDNLQRLLARPDGIDILAATYSAEQLEEMIRDWVLGARDDQLAPPFSPKAATAGIRGSSSAAAAPARLAPVPNGFALR